MAELLASLNNSVWNSGTRIHATHKWAFMAEEAGDAVIPPDVAGAVDLLRERSAIEFAEMISLIRPYDADITRMCREVRGNRLPEGATFFTPLYQQYLLLEAAPWMGERPDSIWWDMPQEYFLASRIQNPSAADAAVLTDLGYIDSANKAASGGTPFAIDESKIAKAKQVRQMLAENFGIQPMPQGKIVLPAVAAGIVWVVGAIAVAFGVVAISLAISEYLKTKTIRDAMGATTDFNAETAAWNLQRVELAREIVGGCVRRATAFGRDPSGPCGNALDRLVPYEAPISPAAAAAQLAGLGACDLTRGCGGWLFLGGALGGIAGVLAASSRRRRAY